MKRIECEGVLFDLDGVLIDSTAAVEHAWRSWLAHMGLAPDTDLSSVHGRRVNDSLLELAPKCDIDKEVAWMVEMESTYTEGVVALEGAEALLKALPKAWAIVTSGGAPVATARVRKAGFPAPPVFVTGDDVTKGKPEPDCYRMGAKKLGVPIERCVVFEDVPAGVESGRRAGAKVVGVLSRFSREALPGADAYVRDMRDVRVVDLGRPGLFALDIDEPAAEGDR